MHAIIGIYGAYEIECQNCGVSQFVASRFAPSSHVQWLAAQGYRLQNGKVICGTCFGHVLAKTKEDYLNAKT